MEKHLSEISGIFLTSMQDVNNFYDLIGELVHNKKEMKSSSPM